MSTTTEAPATRERLDRARVVDAAMAIARRSGLDGLSMRTLAVELDVSTMAAYRHVAGKDEIVRAVAGRVIDEVMALQPNATGSWKDWIRLLAARSMVRIRSVQGLAGVLLAETVPDLATEIWVDAFAAQAVRRRPTSRDAQAQRDTEARDRRARVFAQSVAWLILAAADSPGPGAKTTLEAGLELLLAGYDG